MSIRCMFRLFLFLPFLAFTFQVEHPLFVTLLKEQTMELMVANQHAFFSLQQALVQKVQEIADTRVDDVHELIHVASADSFKFLNNTLRYQFYLTGLIHENTLNSKLTCCSIDPSIAGRTYIFRDAKGAFYALNFQEQSYGSCQKITFGKLDQAQVAQRIDKILDFLLLHDPDFLSMPLKKTVLGFLVS